MNTAYAIDFNRHLGADSSIYLGERAGARVTDRDVERLAAGPLAGQLTQINFDGCPRITDAALNSITRERFPMLNFVAFEGSQVTSTAGRKFEKETGIKLIWGVNVP